MTLPESKIAIFQKAVRVLESEKRKGGGGETEKSEKHAEENGQNDFAVQRESESNGKAHKRKKVLIFLKRLLKIRKIAD